MRKIKILFGFCLTILVLGLIGLITNFIVGYDGLIAHTENQIVFGVYNFYIGWLLSLCIFFGIGLGAKSLYNIIVSGFFTNDAQKLLIWVGYIFLITGNLSIIMDIIRLTAGGSRDILIYSILMNGMLSLFGFIILIIADMTQVGFKLKSENDLTI